jgi:DNA repair and recombination RAD54-like protein
MDCYRQKVAAREPIDDDLAAIAEMFPTADRPSNQSKTSTSNKTVSALRNPKLFPSGGGGGGGGSGCGGHIDPEQSGKMLVLYRMMCTMRALKNGERIVIVSNYTMTLDLIERLCAQNCWPVLRLDGTISGNKRTKLVDEFNSPTSGAFAFLLSSKAGGCGINLIGGSRLVLFDPDWNPASDKQAAARIWREGQKRRCFIYRFMTTGSFIKPIFLLSKL